MWLLCNIKSQIFTEWNWVSPSAWIKFCQNYRLNWYAIQSKFWCVDPCYQKQIQCVTVTHTIGWQSYIYHVPATWKYLWICMRRWWWISKTSKPYKPTICRANKLASITSNRRVCCRNSTYTMENTLNVTGQPRITDANQFKLQVTQTT